MRMIDADRLLNALNSVISDYTSEGKYPDRFGIDDAINLVEDAPTLTPLNEWISVDERLPEVGQEVLVYWRNTSQKAEHFELTHYDGDHWFLLDNTERPWIVVVAWMPLPSPPDRRPPEGEEDT